MKTILTKKIDDYDIIIGIGKADGLIDPEATRKEVVNYIKLTKPYKDIIKIKKQMQTYATQALKAEQAKKTSKTPEEKKKNHDEWLFRVRQIQDLQENIKPILPNLKAVEKELIYKHAVYFGTTANEKIITDVEAEVIEQKMITATDNGNFFDINKSEIVDERGVYWNGIKRHIVYQLGNAAPDGYINEKLLSDEQKEEIKVGLEIERISNMSTLEKEIEKENVLQTVGLKAVEMKSLLEIEGDVDALIKSQEWYEAEKLIVEDRYK